MSSDFISLAIDQMNTADFELWCQVVLAKDRGVTFAPTGGMHDGGQDGFLRSAANDTDHYIQISKEVGTAGKVRRTIASIKKNRNLRALTYVTSQDEGQRDLLEAQIKQEFGVIVEVLDKRWLLVQAQLNDAIRESLYAHSKDIIDGLEKAQNSERALGDSSRLSIVSYLETHVQSLPGTENFQNVCLDTLVYNALIGTNPNEEIFKTTAEIEDMISSEHPNVLGKAEATLEERLEFLSSKANDPRVRKHPLSRYALPYSVRNEFNDGSLHVRSISDSFISSINERFNELGMVDGDEVRSNVIACVQDLFLQTYRRQAMNFAASFSSRDFDSDIKVFEFLRQFVETLDLDQAAADELRDVASTIFRNICYSSNEREQDYLNLLLKYFTIQFVMDGDHAVGQYFSDMAAGLRIYVGTDIIVRCLSEALVQKPSRGMTNSLRLMRASGVKLRVTRQTLGEVFSHIRHATNIFRLEYDTWFRHANLDSVINCDQILIRSFFYARLEPDRHEKRPRDWSNYLRNFGLAAWFAKTDNLTSDEYLDEFGSFLLDKYQLDFVEIDEILETIDQSLASKIANEVLSRREIPTEGFRILATNDAQMALFVNAERNNRNERVSTNLYGFHSWWLTEKHNILAALRKYGQKADVVMHPQFLMNHFVLDPSFMGKQETKTHSIMPTLFGLRITDRIPPGEMRNFVKSIGDLAGLDEAAQRARIRTATNKLKRRGNYPGAQRNNNGASLSMSVQK